MRIAGGFRMIDNVGFSVSQDVGTGTFTTWGDISLATYEASSPSVVSGLRQPVFKPDGTRMFIAGGNDVYQYDLSVAWDVTSMTGSPTGQFTQGQESATQHIDFKPDGTQFWISGNTDFVRSYSLTTPWDITTASYDSVTFGTSGQVSFPVAFQWNTDGTIAWVGEFTNPRDAHQYTASTPYDITTLSYASLSFATNQSSSESWYFNPNGTQFLVGEGLFIHHYTLNTSNDISTAVLANSLNLQGSTVTQGLFVKPDGTKLYNYTGANIDQYDLP